MIVDEHIAIQGSGNQDTQVSGFFKVQFEMLTKTCVQSWYHSQEVNVMIDSALICNIWLQGIRQNQNTHSYGKVCKTGADAGCWVDPVTGKQADAAIGPDAGKFAWAHGIRGAIARVRGTGGF